MIDAYTWPTPNGHKVHIMLEETGLPYPVERYTNEANRLTRVLDEKLGDARYVAGDDYTIADIAIFPWMRGSERRGVTVADYPNVKRWFDEINGRPAVQRGVQVLQDVQAAAQAPHDDKSWEIMFGKVQFGKR